MSLLAPQGGKTPGRPPGYEAARGRRATDRSEAVLMVERGYRAIRWETGSRHGAGCLEHRLGLLLTGWGAGCARGRERRRFHPVPSRTGSCPAPAPESTARATAWEARPPRARPTPLPFSRSTARGGAAAARWAHNPKVAGSNPAPATTRESNSRTSAAPRGPPLLLPDLSPSCVRAPWGKHGEGSGGVDEALRDIGEIHAPQQMKPPNIS